jgi:DMSO/TMAO reductase YedYZ molybdopterin-dependent catalytic subunit
MTPSDDYSLSSTAHLDRRRWLCWATMTGAAAILPSGCHRRPPAVSEAAPADAPMRFPGKVPMRVINDRPPCLETPWEYFRQDLTPNEAFYVRWHLQVIPTSVDVRTWRLRVGGHVERPLELSLDELRRLEPVSIVAVNQCSGNSRGLFKPPIPGAQWTNGGMGNARWTGVRLRDLLGRAGLKAGAVEVAFAGMDRGGPPSVPSFVKSLHIDEARRPEILLAYEMNGEPLPLLNGFPLRLVVPGWYATYWLKALESITVLSKPFDGFWMAKAYRIPTTPNALEKPDALAKDTVPINRMNVRSFFTSPAPNTHLGRGRDCELDGIAFDGGSGIRQVEVSTDAGRSWQATELGEDPGPFSFRRWRLRWQPETPGDVRLLVRATSNAGETQPREEGWNRAGYMRNVIEELDVTVG